MTVEQIIDMGSSEVEDFIFKVGKNNEVSHSERQSDNLDDENTGSGLVVKNEFVSFQTVKK